MLCIGHCWKRNWFFQLRSSWLSSARVIPHSVGKCRRSRQRGRASSKKGGQAATLAKQTSWNRSMDEKQDTAVRHLKKQNGTKCRNFVLSDCKLEYRIGRTADTGEQRSVFAGRFRQGFPRRRFLIPSKSNGFPKKTFSNIF